MVRYPRSIVYCLFKNSFLNTKIQDNFHQFPIFSFQERLLRRGLAYSSQTFWMKWIILLPSTQVTGYSTEMALMAFMNDFLGDQYGGRASILALLDLLGLSMPLIMIIQWCLFKIYGHSDHILIFEVLKTLAMSLSWIQYAIQ